VVSLKNPKNQRNIKREQFQNKKTTEKLFTTKTGKTKTTKSTLEAQHEQ
jgi:hypothetical protein